MRWQVWLRARLRVHAFLLRAFAPLCVAALPRTRGAVYLWVFYFTSYRATHYTRLRHLAWTDADNQVWRLVLQHIAPGDISGQRGCASAPGLRTHACLACAHACISLPTAFCTARCTHRAAHAHLHTLPFIACACLHATLPVPFTLLQHYTHRCHTWTFSVWFVRFAYCLPVFFHLVLRSLLHRSADSRFLWFTHYRTATTCVLDYALPVCSFAVTTLPAILRDACPVPCLVWFGFAQVVHGARRDAYHALWVALPCTRTGNLGRFCLTCQFVTTHAVLHAVPLLHLLLPHLRRYVRTTPARLPLGSLAPHATGCRVYHYLSCPRNCLPGHSGCVWTSCCAHRLRFGLPPAAGLTAFSLPPAITDTTRTATCLTPRACPAHPAALVLFWFSDIAGLPRPTTLLPTPHLPALASFVAPAAVVALPACAALFACRARTARLRLPHYLDRTQH